LLEVAFQFVPALDGEGRLHFRPFVSLVVLCSGVRLLYTCLVAHFSAVFPFFIVCSEGQSSFASNINIKADVRFSLNRNEIKHEQILYENSHATQR